jgi:hypothetical protein
VRFDGDLSFGECAEVSAIISEIGRWIHRTLMRIYYGGNPAMAIDVIEDAGGVY